MLDMYMAIIFSLLVSFIVFFQWSLALGAPWGEWSMGGKFKGQYPLKMRWVALLNSGILIFLILVVLTKTKLLFLYFYELSLWAIWGVVAFSFVQVILHVLTPSVKERRLWLPVMIVLFFCSVTLAY